MSSCAGCGSLFRCAMVDGDDGQTCWCAQLPPAQLPPAEIPAMPDANRADARCFCPQCLAALLPENHRSPDPERR